MSGILKGTKIGFIGGGAMGEALIAGILRHKALGILPKQILVSETLPNKRWRLKKQYKINLAENNQDLVKKSDVVILAVKPKDISGVLTETAPAFTSKKLLISIVAGTTTKKLESFFKKIPPIVRAMPNTPSRIGLGMTVICGGKKAKAQHLQLSDKIFSAVGLVENLPEKYFDAVTAISGSGPAFLAHFIEASIEGGKKIGLTRTTAAKLALQTALGTVQLLKELEPRELIKMVASPGGTTEAGLKHLQKKQFARIVHHTIEKAAQRSAAMRRGK